MPTEQVVKMITDTLGVMAIGVPAVFAVLGIFYLSVRLTMSNGSKKNTD